MSATGKCPPLPPRGGERGRRPRTLAGSGRRFLGASLALLLFASCAHRGVTPIRTPFNKGVYHYSRGDYDAAIAEYRKALEQDAGDLPARFNLAVALEAQAAHLEDAGAPVRAEELRQEAEERYRELLVLDPHHLRATVNLAAREYQEGEVAAAEARLAAAIERHPRSALPRTALAAHRLREGSPAAAAQAVQLLEKALRRDAANAAANMLLGEALVTLAGAEPPDRELLERARQAYGRALEVDGSDLATLLALARLERLAGRPEEAARWLRRAVYVKPELLEAHLMLAEVLDAAGDLEGATFHLWQGRALEDERWPRLSPEEYRQRLLSLYRRLQEQELRESAAP